MNLNAEALVDAGVALTQLGRHLQRTMPEVTIIGSQHEEDLLLDDLLPGDGLFIDCGAFHPRECSNSYRLHERGWTGLLIEPLPACWPMLLIERPECYLFPGAASDKDGWAMLHTCRSVSSLYPEWRDDSDGSILVQTATLRSILGIYKQVDWSRTRFMSIDAEGWEAQVLAGVPWEIVRPEILMIEFADQNGVDTSWRWMDTLVVQGYKVFHKNHLNMILKRA